jgi:hypothetical protein
MSTGRSRIVEPMFVVNVSVQLCSDLREHTWNFCRPL